MALHGLPARPEHGHKGTFGTVAIIGGCHRQDSTMLGAPLLAGRAALRSGVGLCRLIVPRPLLVPALATLPSATGIGFDGIAPEPGSISADALVIGPGMGADDDGSIAGLVYRVKSPVVIDADGLNAIAKLDSPGQLSGRILTPHPGEAERLADAFGVSVQSDTPSDRIRTARSLADATGAIVVLKGRGTVVAQSESTEWVCEHGHPCLGTAGTGDVLAGLIGGLLAQSIAGEWDLSPFDLVCYAVDAHARAGERWASLYEAQAGLLASELADLLPSVLHR